MHLARFIVGGIFAVLASVLLWLGRAAIGSSTPLLLAVVGGYLAALSLVAPAQMDQAKAALSGWLKGWKAP